MLILLYTYFYQKSNFLDDISFLNPQIHDLRDGF